MNATTCEYRTHGDSEAGSGRAKRLRPAARSGPEGAKRGWLGRTIAAVRTGAGAGLLVLAATVALPTLAQAQCAFQ